ncbi:tetratricopeptide repeat protein [Methylobacter sp. YRD-M1]|uniref:tetratricopeptide repeat protein n=1 Tax=Methylobacter sp. YRD-M1 TaxID=2911520 RepID=UPI00227CABF7|nr:tetratricopeptide repeat protein [Methylobacter sp. YRD-M1]WAK01129.1 tetratricopeptide repeat protein [Methylobacter sp. YRD-M1]
MQLVRTLLLTGVALSFQACGDATEKAQHYLDSGKEFYGKGNYEKARVEFKNALQINNNLSDAYFHLALMDEKSQNWKGMFENLSQVVKLTPDHVEGHKKLGQLLLLSGQTDKAAAEAEAILKLNPDNADAHVLKGTVLLRQGNQKAALEEADKALALAPGNSDAVNLKAVVYMESKDFTQALAIVEDALKVNANDLALNLLKLQIDIKTNKPEAVVADYQSLIKSNPDNLDFQYALAKYYAESGKDADARSVLQKVIDEHPDDLKSKLVLIDYLHTKEPAEAVKVLQGYIVQQPDTAGYYLPLAKLLISQNKWAEAKESLNWLINNKPEDKEGLAAKVLLAKIALSDKDNDSAQKLIDEVLSVNAGDYDALLLRARIRLLNEQTDQAVSDLRGILRDYPKSDDAMVLLAHAYNKQNAHALADEHFRKALDINPGNFDAVMPVIAQMIKNKDIARADEVLQKALAVKPDHAGALQALAQVRLMKKDWAGTQKVADAISTKPKGDGFSKYLSGKVSEGQGQYQEAVAKYKDALAVSPGLSDALVGLMRSYEALKQRKDMFAYLDEFIKANPENPYPLVLKSQLYVLDKRPDEAVKLLSGAIEKWPKVTGFYEAMAGIHAANQEREKAIAVIQKGLGNDPDNISLRIMLAAIYEKSNDYDKAVENYEAIIAKNPNVDIAVNNLVSLLLDRYKTKENIDRAVKLAARFEKSQQPYFYDTYGWALLNSDRNDEALRVFKDVVAKMPDVPVFKYHLGLAHHKLNNNSAAIAELEKALTIGEKQKSFVEKELVENLLKEIKAEKPV